MLSLRQFQFIILVCRETAATQAINVETAGWGAIRHNGASANQLQRLDKRTLTHTDCTSRIGSNPWMNVNKICTLPIGRG
jgi:hypothetical protein